MDRVTRLGDNLFVYHGVANVGIVRDGEQALLIDCGDNRVLPALKELGIQHVGTILLTHHHRDNAAGAGPFVQTGAKVAVPAGERALFEDVASYWNNPTNRWHIYHARPRLVLTEPIPVHAAYKDGETIKQGRTTITVVETPGHTDGSVSYQVDLAEAKRFIFSGDLIYNEGQIYDLYSLQKGWETLDYHGFLGDRKRLIESLLKLKAAGPSALVPSHGRIMTDPARAVDSLVDRISHCYEKYVAISALRHYFPQMFAEYAGLEAAMPIREGKPAPACLRHIGTSWVIVSESRAAFVIDCGAENVIQELEGLQAKGEIGQIEGLWITHYHDDHVDAIPKFKEAFGCPVIADRALAQVVEDPLAWRLPCISPSVVEVDRRTRNGERWKWQEFTMTAYFLPGQTLYHDGLLVEGRGVRMFFAGDSFTMAGIDDYCAGNRNFLGRGVGFDACISLIQELEPSHIFNCHVDVAFDFTDDECRYMRANLAEREKLYGQLFPWDHPNYGMDEQWVRCHPYEQAVKPGRTARIEVVVTNHSSRKRRVECRPVPPRSWQAVTLSRSATLPAKSEGRIAFDLAVPVGTQPGRWVVPVEVVYSRKRLGQFAEAVVAVKS